MFKNRDLSQLVRLGFENKNANMVSEQARRRKLNRFEGREWKSKGVCKGSIQLWAEGEVNENSSVQKSS